MGTKADYAGANFRHEGLPVRRWLLLSLLLHGLFLLGLKVPAQPLPAPALLLNATLRLIVPPDVSPVAAVSQESKVAKAPARARQLQMATSQHRPLSIAHAAPQPEGLAAPAGPRPTTTEAGRPGGGEASREAAAPPIPPPDQQQLLGRYAQQLSRLLASHQDYPRLAALRGWEGEVRLRLKVARQGNLLYLRVDRSSGHEILDQHALQLVDLVRMPPFPDEFEGNEIQITVPVNYKLNKAV
jgi:protein TonB